MIVIYGRVVIGRFDNWVIMLFGKLLQCIQIGSIKRFNMFTTAVIRGAAAQGYSSGQAMEIMEQIARDHLPDNIGLEWSGLSYQEKQAGGQTGMVMALVFLFVFLFLAAQYESWTVPIAVLLSLPVAALGAYLGVWVCRMG